MNLLLLLSALLSALTGGASAMRAPAAAHAVASSCAAVRSQARIARVASRPLQAPPSLMRSALRPLSDAIAGVLTIAGPLYASRRRE
jgi:hypothetical protein